MAMRLVVTIPTILEHGDIFLSGISSTISLFIWALQLVLRKFLLLVLRHTSYNSPKLMQWVQGNEVSWHSLSVDGQCILLSRWFDGLGGLTVNLGFQSFNLADGPP